MWFHLRILEKCNLNCVSCYARENDRSKMMDFPMFKDILKTIGHIQEKDTNISVIYLSGGEPLLHPEFSTFLNYCYPQFDRISVLTNGLLVKKNIEVFLPYREKLCVQVSLDGDEKTNDSIRGKGVYQKVIESLHILEQNNINHWMSYTVSRSNKHCYKHIIDISVETNSFFNNVTPYVGEKEQMLDYREWKEFKYHYEKYTLHKKIRFAHGPNCCGFRYNCGAFYSGITINPDGNAAGCARINNVKGHYKDMGEFLLSSPKSITETCMKGKWPDNTFFNTLCSLE